MPAIQKASILQRLAQLWMDSPPEPDAADLGTAFGMDCYLAEMEHQGRDDDARAAAASCWPSVSAPAR